MFKVPIKTPYFLLVLAIAAALSSISLIGPPPAHAITTISQGYTSKDKIPLGAIVSLQEGTQDKVNASHTENINSILGIVIGSESSLLSVSNGESQIQVATEGVAQVLVSDINGDIKKGDYITASPISGVGMKVTTSTKAIGIAQEDLTQKNSSKQKYKDKTGEHEVRIGQIPLLVNVSYYYNQPDKTIIPIAIQNVANAFAGRKVNSMPILISAGIFLVTIIVITAIIYSMIRSSIISVGRNPLSQGAVYRNIIMMSGLVVGILAVSTAAIYLILRTF
jgi:hypothetical protein